MIVTIYIVRHMIWSLVHCYVEAARSTNQKHQLYSVEVYLRRIEGHVV
jgi:hypothetical protein